MLMHGDKDATPTALCLNVTNQHHSTIHTGPTTVTVKVAKGLCPTDGKPKLVFVRSTAATMCKELVCPNTDVFVSTCDKPTVLKVMILRPQD